MRIRRVIAIAVATSFAIPMLFWLSEARALGKPFNGTITRDVRYAHEGGAAQLLDAYFPEDGSGPVPAIIVVHGGGFYMGSKDDTDVSRLSTVYAALGYAVFNINYRLAPTHPYPAANEDVQHAIAFVRENAERFGVDPGRLAIVGSSAGSTLAAWAAFRGEGPLDVGSRVAAVVTFSGSFDLPALASQIPADDARVDPVAPGHGYLTPGPDLMAQARDASPVTYVDPSDPPILMINSANELAPVAQPQAMLEEAQQQGVRARLIVRRGSAHALNGPHIAPYVLRSIVFLDQELDHDGFAYFLLTRKRLLAHPRILLAIALLTLLVVAYALPRRVPVVERRG